MILTSLLNVTFTCFLECYRKIINCKGIWFSSIRLLEYVLKNRIKAVCGKSCGRWKQSLKNKSSLFYSSFVILHS